MREMTWPDYAARVGEAILFLPVGSTEQHGPHLPLGTDSIQVEHAAALVAERLGGIVAPTINYGYRSAPKSGGGEIFPGTTSLSGATLIGLVSDILKAFIRHGAKRIVVLDGHYENNMFLHEAIHRALEESGADDVTILKVLWAEALSPETLDRAFPDGFPGWALEHAAHLETSAVYAIRPDLVVRDEVRPDGAQNLPLYDIYPQPRDLVPASGVLADPSRATAEVGAMLFDDSVARLVESIGLAFGREGGDRAATA
jgi:creatinine amidohydrolase